MKKNKGLKIAFWMRSGQKIAFHVPLQHAFLFSPLSSSLTEEEKEILS